jgi:hypothetical protein
MIARLLAGEYRQLAASYLGPAANALSSALILGIVSCAVAGTGAGSQTISDDGSRSAPVGPAQHPSLLQAYPVHPSWKVAGVDYAVGLPPAVPIKHPTANNLPEGATFSDKTIQVVGRDVTLDGYDLSGITVLIDEHASGTATIKNCGSFGGAAIRSSVTAKAQLVVTSCTLDGGGMASDPNFQTIKVWCPLVVTHSWIKDGPGGIQSGASLTARFNLLEGFAWTAGAHANAIYVRGTNRTGDATVIAYNTIYSQSSRNISGFPVGIGAAIAFFGDGGSFYNSTVSNNVLISDMPGAASYLIGFYVDADAVAMGGKITDNYLASVNGFNRKNSGAFGAFYPGSRGSVQADYIGNIDMNTGLAVVGRPGRRP